MKKTYTDIGIAPQNPGSGLLLRGLEFGPVQPYGLIRAQAKPFPQNDHGGINVPIADPATVALDDSVRERKLMPLSAGVALLAVSII